MRTYKHLTMTDRLRIEKWLKMGMKPREVADKLRVHVSTIYRELKRGAYDRLDGGTWEVKTAYSPDIAEEKYQAHLREKGPDLKIGNDHELANYIETTILDKDCSPAAVLGFAMIEGKKFKTSLSVPTIYKYIAKGLFLNLTQEELPRHGKKKHKYKKVKKNKSASRAPAGESIEQRPEEIDGREEFGHWEGDTVYSGKGKRKTTRALLTLTERKTRKEIIIAIPNRKAETVVKALDALERKLGARRFRAIFKSITFDNGTEFAAAEELRRSDIRAYVSSAHVGSMGAILALSRGEAQLGGIHLLDEQDGSYNVSYVEQYIPGGGVALIECVRRAQGLMVQKGNPLGIASVKDLARSGVRYANRQKGAGTRVLLDYLLKQNGISAQQIEGYAREELTHTAVAAQISAGSADCGLGILSAARMYDLDFVPICEETYDLLVSLSAMESPQVRAFLRILGSEAFLKRLDALGGYTYDQPGRIKKIWPEKQQ